MESRNSRKYPNVVEEKQPFAPVKTTEYNYVRRSIRSMVEARIRYVGAISGEQYEWPRAGSVVSVDERDVPELLAKRLGTQSCCGANDSNRVFDELI